MLSILLLLLTAYTSPLHASERSSSARLVGRLPGGAQLMMLPHGGVAVTGYGAASVQQQKPVHLEFYGADGVVIERDSAYQRVNISHGRAHGTAEVAGPEGTRFAVADTWQVDGGVVRFSRAVKVMGSAAGGFLSGIVLSHPQVHARGEIQIFAPGMIYGGVEHLSPEAIGGSATYRQGGTGQVHIREDRLPAPMVGVRFADGSAMTMLDPSPDGATVNADANDTAAATVIDAGLRFGAIGTDVDGGHNDQGFWFPGSEGEVTYKGNTYPGGQMRRWRRRYHPIQNGLTQSYRLEMRFSREESFPVFMRAAWRWAATELHPPVLRWDLRQTRADLIDLLAEVTEVHGERAGIPNSLLARASAPLQRDPKAVMGFCGKNLEAAEELLADAIVDPNAERAAKHRELALKIVDSFVRLKMDPPVGEGFDLDTGKPVLAIPSTGAVFLRSFTDDMKALLRAYRDERAAGHEHSAWLAWVKSFADWLLTQELQGGGFPRSWRPGSGEVLDRSAQSSFEAVPLLALLGTETGDRRYTDAAIRTGVYSWTHGHAEGQFVGGTIDNPDVLDKEAGTLSVEAYLALFHATHAEEWLSHARAAADYAETYVYLWNVPMPNGAKPATLHWEAEVPTYGTQLIATGHSLVDEYMADDVGEFMELGRRSNDAHYLRMAELLLYDTKGMIATADHLHGLRGAGWSQEHFSLAPMRGMGLHQMWLPWVSTTQLRGMMDAERLEAAGRDANAGAR